jgi:hypothetical protein
VLESKRPILERAEIAFPELGAGDPWRAIEAWMEPMLQP